MKKYNILITLITVLSCMLSASAQTKISKLEGTCGEDTKWVFDGYTLVISNASKDFKKAAIDDYDTKSQKTPWSKLSIRRVEIEDGITRIGSCAFANCNDLQEVVFKGTSMREIGWGAFLNCSHLRNISLPVQLRTIETIAFANCSSLASTKIPDQCRIGDQAFMSCTNLRSLELSPTTILGHHVFATEIMYEGKIRHALYNGEIRKLPSYINKDNCHEFGLAQPAVEKVTKQDDNGVDYDYQTAEVDSFIPVSTLTRHNTYALIIGNQNYRFVPNVPYAIHDARVFGEYCKKTLGIPMENIHISEDATKQMILEEELEDWVRKIPDQEDKKLIVYYAGHGVPDIKNKNKAYILPTDVRGTAPQRGIALDDFYLRLGQLGFKQTSVFLDACFSGINRDNEGVSEGLRGVEIEAEESTLGEGSIVVFSAAQGNETAQGFPEKGHGLFTYYLLKELQESEGYISYGTLSDRLKSNVSRQALQLKMRKQQSPATNTTGELAEQWRTLGF